MGDWSGTLVADYDYKPVMPRVTECSGCSVISTRLLVAWSPDVAEPVNSHSHMAVQIQRSGSYKKSFVSINWPSPSFCSIVQLTDTKRKYLAAQPSKYSSRIGIINASGDEVQPALSPANPVAIIEYLEQAFSSWIAKELQETGTTQIEGRTVAKPSWIIEDLFNGGVSLACKDVHNLPVVTWWSTTAASLISQQGNKENGHGGRIYEHLVQQKGTPPAELSKIYLESFSDRLVCIPGLPVHHEWELVTQYLPFAPPLVSSLAARRENMLKYIDAMICCTTLEMEPISAGALSNALSQPLSPFFIGPAVDLPSPQQPDPDSPVTQFLDRTYAEKGSHSVVYVAFGTVFFPPPSSTSHLMAALDEIPKAGLRFIFALSSRGAQVDQSWIDAHIRAGNAIFPEWTNQTQVLEHPVGLLDPSDQPANASQIASVHNCGFELLQVRTGPAKSAAYRNGAEVKIVGSDDAVREEMRGILELTKGPRGEHQRANTRLLGKAIANSLAPGGSADIELEKFGKMMGLL
ncbi:hypothetical protein AG1IA_01929 [Rhizoctonia solani AG-1 IA]|uniref:Uncharacterized protein n=1 Tax=Thanatephorus cucumeris (strain AG1-IA) TaxID=983506 RepID=L8X4K6_THACA|nr:hypothetical protein AG1IA_01929 [Rhizoctonia solani AG-1 IA]